MKAGTKRLTTALMAGGLSAMVVSGCGSSDSPSGPEWTSTVPASTSGTQDRPGDDTSIVEEAVSGNIVTTNIVETVTTAAVNTIASPTVPTTIPAGPSATSTGSNPLTANEKLSEAPVEAIAVTTTQEAEGRLITEPGAVMANDYWEDLGLPDPATPPVDDPERMLYAAEQLRKVYFKWYDGIYRKDPEALWEAVTRERAFERGLTAMEGMTFIAPPTLEGVKVEVLELYIDRPDCLVAAYQMDISSFRESGLIERITILWPHPQYGWRRNVSFGWPIIYGMWWENCFVAERPEFP